MTGDRNAGPPKGPPEPSVAHGWAIVGPYGNVWHDGVFERPEEAWAYLDRFWRNVPKANKGFRVCRAEQTTAVLMGDAGVLEDAPRP
jgi:hypothetical protein